MVKLNLPIAVMRSLYVALSVTSLNNGTFLCLRLNYNHMQNWSIGKSPFEVVCTHLPCLTTDLANIPSSIDLSAEAESMATVFKSCEQMSRIIWKRQPLTINLW